MDSAIGTAAVLHVRESGLSSVSIVSSDIAGAQLQRDTAVHVAEQLDIEVSDMIEYRSGTADFEEIAERVGTFMPEAVLVFAPPEASGMLVNAGAELGESWFIVGGTELFEPAFVEAATYESIQQHASVAFTGFAHTEDAAWIFYRGEGVVYPLSAGNICALETQPRSAGQRPDRPLYSRHSSRQVCPPG